MNKQQYRIARRMIRDNGRYAHRWLDPLTRADMEYLQTEQDSTDKLAERASILAYCTREGIACTVRHTS